MGELVLSTERLELRVIDLADADLHMQHLNTPSVKALLGGPRSQEALVEKMEKSRDLFAQERFGFTHVWERESGELVGHCGMKRVDNPLAPNQGDHEVGWLIREDRWRLGYASEAMRAVIDWAFEAHGAPHVVALTSLTNVPSWKLMEKLGMERRPELDFADPDYPEADNPTIQYRLMREQWSARQ